MPRPGGAAERDGLEKPVDFDRLPKRFRDYVQALERQLFDAQKLVEEMPESPVWLETYSRERTRRFLPKDARVHFQTSSGIVEVSIGVKRGGAGVQISSPDGRLIVLPEVSNEISVRVRDL